MKTLKFEVSVSLPDDALHRVSPHKMQESIAAAARQMLHGVNLTKAGRVIVTETTEAR